MSLKTAFHPSFSDFVTQKLEKFFHAFPRFGRDGEEDGMQVTFAQYFMPDGTVVHKVGLTPDVIVDMPEEMLGEYLDLGDMSDPQLQAAWEEAVKLRQDETLGAETASVMDQGQQSDADWSFTAEDLLPAAQKM